MAAKTEAKPEVKAEVKAPAENMVDVFLPKVPGEKGLKYEN